MSGLIIDGTEHLVEGLDVINWRDDQRLVRSREDGRLRKTRWVRMQINHTTKGIPGGKRKEPQTLLPGGVDGGKEFHVAAFWSNSPKQSGAHTVIDTDGSIGQLADLLTTAMYHAGSVNEYSIGHEIYQLSSGGIYESTLRACVAMNLAICKLFGIQFQIHRPYKGKPFKRLSKGGKDCVGIFGHHDQTNNRGPGDPGEFIKDMLVEAGAEEFDFGRNEDIAVWKERQDELGLVADGIPGPQTVQALKAVGYDSGIWALGKVHEQPDLKSFICTALGCDD